MATKIIHILKDDKPDEIISEFQNSDAEEVIFIFPNNSKFGQDEIHFRALEYEAKKLGKTVTVLSSSDKIRDYSYKYKFQFVQSPKTYTPKSDTEADIKEVEEDMPHNESVHKDKEKYEHYPEEDKNEEDKESDDYLPDSRPHDLEEGASADEEEHKIRAELAVKKTLSDIVSPGGEKDIPIRHMKERGIPLEIRRYDRSINKEQTGKIENIWFKKFWGSDRQPKKQPKKRNISKRWLVVFLIISISALLLIIYSTFGSAQIIIKPQTQQLDFQIKVSASSSNSKVDQSFNVVPGEYFTVEQTESKTVQTTGQKEVAQKAKGKITVFNNFSSSSQPLVATTRFETADGLIFRTPKSIIVPGAVIENGVQKPGQIEIEVIADQVGEKYNIGPSDFTIPGLKGTPKFDKINARSESKMSGGIVGLANIVTEKDFNQAKEELKKNLFEKIKKDFKKKALNLVVIETPEPAITSFTASNQAEEAATELILSMTAKSSTVAFAEKDILELINSFVQKTGDLVLIKESLNIEYKNPQINEKGQSLIFNIAVKVRAGAKIDENQIAQKLAGLKEKEIKELIHSIKEIETAKIILSPFWVSRIPKNPDKIKIKVQYEPGS